MSSKTDLRVIRTRKMIKDAFIQLVTEKGFDAMTIHDITEKAMINRGTFYLHYQDKFDLMEKLTEDILGDVIGNINPSLHLIDGKLHTGNLKVSIASVFEAISSHTDFFQAMLGGKGSQDFSHKMLGIIKGRFDSEYSKAGLKEENMLLPRELILTFVSSACHGMMIWWLQNGMVYSPAYMANSIVTIMTNGPARSFGVEIIDDKR
ncbi:TetR/AcrR family transcriptional regulator [Metabacillus sp. KIGAM252]|uniref:TetR/AcrR family transcriptional regulator n=1 Tax=Metabacillus flavus TaxID=2823519 RepID=A0ABS5LA36_9BACI|nr:TetR/AcrR family transcriptional regulator [Metabacillus flavus]MBS2967584.1 TetR/AcrR family transcriptional regulator [Metabacillus flavus]